MAAVAPTVVIPTQHLSGGVMGARDESEPTDDLAFDVRGWKCL